MAVVAVGKLAVAVALEASVQVQVYRLCPERFIQSLLVMVVEEVITVLLVLILLVRPAVIQFLAL